MREGQRKQHDMRAVWGSRAATNNFVWFNVILTEVEGMCARARNNTTCGLCGQQIAATNNFVLLRANPKKFRTHLSFRHEPVAVAVHDRSRVRSPALILPRAPPCWRGLTGHQRIEPHRRVPEADRRRRSFLAAARQGTRRAASPWRRGAPRVSLTRSEPSREPRGVAGTATPTAHSGGAGGDGTNPTGSETPNHSTAERLRCTQHAAIGW